MFGLRHRLPTNPFPTPTARPFFTLLNFRITEDAPLWPPQDPTPSAGVSLGWVPLLLLLFHIRFGEGGGAIRGGWGGGGGGINVARHEN